MPRSFNVNLFLLDSCVFSLFRFINFRFRLFTSVERLFPNQKSIAEYFTKLCLIISFHKQTNGNTISALGGLKNKFHLKYMRSLFTVFIDMNLKRLKASIIFYDNIIGFGEVRGKREIIKRDTPYIVMPIAKVLQIFNKKCLLHKWWKLEIIRCVQNIVYKRCVL